MAEAGQAIRGTGASLRMSGLCFVFMVPQRKVRVILLFILHSTRIHYSSSFFRPLCASASLWLTTFRTSKVI